MEKDPSLDAFMRSVRQKPEVRLPCADCAELLYLTVKQCPFCKGRSVLKPCKYCGKEMRLFFELAAQQDYCQGCTYKLSREQLQCAYCKQVIPTDEPHVTYAQRILHQACLEPYTQHQTPGSAVPAPGAGEAEQAARSMEQARQALARAAQPVQKPAAPARDAKGCGAAVLVIGLAIAALFLG